MQTSLQSDADLLKDLERVRFVSRNFENLQGLYSAWWGLTLLFGCAGGYLEKSNLFGVRIFAYVLEAVSVLGVMFASPYIALPRLRDYYQRFGVVRARGVPCTQQILAMFTYAITSFLPLHGGQRVYVVCGLSWFVVGLYRPQMDRIGLGLGILAFAALKDFLPPVVSSLNPSFFLCGAATLVAGLLDHRLLVDTLGSAPAPADDCEEAEATEATWP